MKFCDNLQKLRKSKNISQEQLAEMLGVTRQSVSKWESGASYPEMEKLTEMCKIFHCSLDTLVNGDVMEETQKKEKSVFYSILSSLEISVRKTIAMLEGMSASQIIKFLFTLFIICMVILVCKIPFVILEDSINSIFYHGASNFMTSFLASLWSFLLNLAYGILAILSFLYVYKIKYLDQIELVDNEEERLRIQKEEAVIQKEKKVVKSPKYVYQEHSGIFDFLTTMFLYFLKFICAIVLVWDLCALVTSVILFVFIIILAFKGLLLIGPILIAMGVIGFTILVAILLLNFIANKKSNQVGALITLFTSIVLGCVGVALSCWYFTGLTYIEGIPNNYQKKEVSQVYDMTENLIVQNHYNVYYVEDNSLTDRVMVTVEYYYDHYKPEVELISDQYITYHTERKNSSFYPKDLIDDIIHNLKKKKFYTYENLFRTKMIIKTSKDNIQKLKKNTFKEYSYDEDSDDIEYQEEFNEYFNE